MKSIKIFKWSLKHSPYGNFGDEISSDILREIIGYEPVSVHPARAELIAAGSILDTFDRKYEKVPRQKRMIKWAYARLFAPRDLHVWGSGIMNPESQVLWPQSRIHYWALRGELTRLAAGQQNQSKIVLGDPGILASRLVEKRATKTHRIAFVPNHVDMDWLKTETLPRHWLLVDPIGPTKQVLAQIAGSDLVIASSLHGLISADSFGIPCVWIKTTLPLAGDATHKYLDYASSRNCPFNQPLDYIELTKKSVAEINALATVAQRDIAAWQDELIGAFPSI